MYDRLMLILWTNLGILIVPGLNFAIVTRYAINEGMIAALRCALGITIAIMSHVLFALLGLSPLLLAYPALFQFIKIAGAIYIFFLASKILYSALSDKEKILVNAGSENQWTSKEYPNKSSPFFNGFLVDFLNPFVTIFYLGLFSGILNESVNKIEYLFYFLIIFSITLLWFSFIAVLFSRIINRNNLFNSCKSWIELCSSLILFYFSFNLFMSR